MFGRRFGVAIRRCGAATPLLARRGLSSSSSLPSATAASIEALREWWHAAPQLPTSDGRPHRVTVITGAGISTASGIPDYRSPGRPPHNPIQHGGFMSSHPLRQRYWLRSMLGFPRLTAAPANDAHRAVAHAMNAPTSVGGSARAVSYVITQNVDGLHQKAGANMNRVLQLHGDIHSVICMTCHRHSARADLQNRLIAINPQLAPHLSHLMKHADLLRTGPYTPAAAGGDGSTPRGLRPDGDAFVSDQTINELAPAINIPACPHCTAAPHIHLPQSTAADVAAGAAAAAPTASLNVRPPGVVSGTHGRYSSIIPHTATGDRVGLLKPNVVFFGGNVPPETASRARGWIADSESVLVVGTSLTTFSAYRLILQALGATANTSDDPLRAVRRVCILNDGPTRADELFTAAAAASESGNSKPDYGHRLLKLSGRAEHILPAVFGMVKA